MSLPRNRVCSTAHAETWVAELQAGRMPPDIGAASPVDRYLLAVTAQCELSKTLLREIANDKDQKAAVLAMVLASPIVDPSLMHLPPADREAAAAANLGVAWYVADVFLP